MRGTHSYHTFSKKHSLQKENKKRTWIRAPAHHKGLVALSRMLEINHNLK
jgi:hypothetical protein